MREREVEAALRKAIEARGGYALKFVSPGKRGVPDRLLLLPGGVIAFVEVKAPGRQVAPDGLQAFWQHEIAALGFPCCVIDSPQQAQRLAATLGRASEIATKAKQRAAQNKKGGAPLA